MKDPKRKKFAVILIFFISYNFISLSSSCDNSRDLIEVNTSDIVPFLNSRRIHQNETEILGFFDPENVSAFINEYIPTITVFGPLGPVEIAGGAISIVKDGELFLAEGFGYANRGDNVLVDVNETLFRVGSISKTFIAVAVLQLVEDGLLDLNEDINAYLTTFSIPDAFNEPVTLLHLLTHTAGFESTSYLGSSTDPSEIPSLEDVLSDSIPNRIRPPGEVSSFSNYGITLAGYIVEQISGVSFDRYIETNVLLPLEMNHSTFSQPLPSDLLSNLSESYSSALSPANFEYVTMYPGDSLSSSPVDMAKLMIALLDNGSSNGNGILSYDSLVSMRSDHFKWHPSVSGVCLGMYHFDTLNQSIIGHTGVRGYYSNIMALIPEENIGIFITCNSQYGLNAIYSLFYGLQNQYYPYEYSNSTEAIIEPMKNYQSRVSRYTGTYMFNQRFLSDSSLEFEISSVGGGRIAVTNQGVFWEEINFVEVEPLLFREVSGTYDITLAFAKDQQGHITLMSPSWIDPTGGFDKVHPWYDPLEFQQILIVVLTILSLSTFFGWGYIAYANLESGRKADKLITRLTKWYLLLIYIVSQVFLLSYNERMNSKTVIISEMPTFLADIYPLVYILSVTILISVLLAFLAWWGKGNNENAPYWTLRTRIHYSIVVAIYLGFFWLFSYWMFI
ncbi:MAG: serine hydrolase domain-containing protein [Candidatus Hodarchaeales archaeon]|jgi:CubicO group peptidase (beta-lactamase class C family)